MLEKGRAFGRYVIEDLLGEGGMGKVYRAQDTRLHRRVALKVLLLPKGHTDGAQWEEAKARMLREARAAAALEHPNAVSIYDLGAVDGTPFIAMELVQGKNLHAYVGDAGAPWELKLRWLLDAASALAAAHDAGLVHRDVKPENVMVRDDGRVKVLDFGIARRATSPAQPNDPTQKPELAAGTLTGQGVIIGTLRYMPPEQLAGRPLDGRADQFAWGVMAYELYAGETPWPANDDVIATVTAVLAAPAPPLEARAPFLPREVCAAIHRALAKSPEDRFASMPELMAALEPFAAPPASHVSMPPRALSSSSSVPVVPVSSRSGQSIDPHAATAAVRPSTDKAVSMDPAPAPAASVKTSRAWVGVGMIGAAAALAFGALALSRSKSDAPATQASAPAASASAPAALSLLDLPRPASSVDAANTAYREGIQAMHDANREVAQAAFLRAAQADPAMGAAKLRHALAALFFRPKDARTTFLQATQLRAALSPYDLALLEAVTPIFEQHPSDWTLAESRLAQAAQKFPKDAELHYYLAWARQQLAQLDRANAAADAALAIDPTYAAALHLKAQVAQFAGDVPGVERAIKQCLEAAPQAATCVHARLTTYAQEGRCTDYDADAHRLVVINPDGYEGYEAAAQAGFVLGRPIDGVWESLKTAWSHADDRPFEEANDRVAMTVLAGDAKGMNDALDVLDRAVANRTEQYYRMNAAWTRVSALTELGETAKAGKIADEFLRKKDAWSQDPGVDEYAIALDILPVMYKAMLRGGMMTLADLDQKRAAWIDGWKKRVTPEVARYLWIYGYAELADTPAEAQQALDAQPPFAPIPTFRPSLLADARVGRVYQLAGKLDEAIPMLQRAVAHCDAFEDPFTLVRASLWLGEALESKGKTDDACAAYKRVTQRFGPFGARSVTSKEARAHAQALGCK
jgi:serine/threonine-protein kinase